jgi:hypothetical protein
LVVINSVNSMASGSEMRHPVVVNRRSDPHSSSPVAGRWYLAFLGLILVLIGAVFFWLMWRSYDRAREMHEWPEVPCVILNSEVEPRPIDFRGPPEFRVKILFGYEYGGLRRTSERITWRGSPWSAKYSMVEQRVKSFPIGMETTCRVDPQNPEVAVLEPDTKAAGYSIWFPLLFIVAGLGITLGAMFPRRNSKN